MDKDITQLNRVAQFAAFSPLKGYHELIAKEESIKEPKIDIEEDELTLLQQKLNQLSPGDLLLVKYYYIDSYRIIIDTLKSIDTSHCLIKLNKQSIPIKDIRNIELYCK